MQNLRPNDERAKRAINIIWIVLGLEILSFLSGYMQYELLQSFLNGEDISEEAANANDLREQVIGILYLIAYIVSIVIFIQWFRRAYFNLHQKISYLSHREDWAVGAWFVPIVNLYRPYKIMKELYEETITLLNKHEVNVTKKTEVGVLMGWWALWLANGFLGQIVFRITMRAESLDQFIDSTTWAMIANIAGIPLALITIKVIRDYSQLEKYLFELKENSVEDNIQLKEF